MTTSILGNRVSPCFPLANLCKEIAYMLGNPNLKPLYSGILYSLSTVFVCVCSISCFRVFEVVG